MSRNERNWLMLAVVVLLLFLSCMGIAPLPIQPLATVLLGWWSFIERVVPQIRVRWGMVGSAALYAAVFLVGSHFFLRWLYRETASPAVAGGPAKPRIWRWKWTGSGLLLVLLMFLCGMATIGIAHQVAWLATSPEPIMKVRGRELANRIKCAANLKSIGQALLLFANDHDGHYPENLIVLVEQEYLSASSLVCWSSSDEPATGPTTQAVIAALAQPHHCSYFYFGHGLAQPVDPDRIIACEPLANHQRAGMEVLFGDGHVDWLDKTEVYRAFAASGLVPIVGDVPAPTTRPTH